MARNADMTIVDSVTRTPILASEVVGLKRRHGKKLVGIVESYDDKAALGDSLRVMLGVLGGSEMAVDGVTEAISALNFDWMTAAAVFLDRYTYFLFLGLAVLLYVVYPSVRRNRLKIAAFVIALVAVAWLTLVVKDIYREPRPCINLKLPECPEDYSFPSGHTAYSFVFAGASIGTAFFPVFFLLSIIVALSRMYLGVHTLNDVAGSIVVSLAAYLTVETLLREFFPQLVPEKERGRVEERRERPGAHFEVRRQLIHIIFGTGVMALLYALGRTKAELLLVLALFVGMTLMQLRLERHRAAFIDELFDLLERPKVMPARGAVNYVLGSLLALAFLSDFNQMMATIAILAWGDGAATLFGQFGRTRLPWSRKKTALGAFAFFAFASASAYLFVGPVALLVALVCTLFETLELRVDDNFLVPLVAVAFFVLAPI